MTPLSIAWVNLRRTLRDRTSLFFLFLFPMLLILVLGLAFGGEFVPRVAVVSPVSTGVAGDLVAGLEENDGIDVQRVDSRQAAVSAVEEGRVEGAVILPADYDSRVLAGDPVTLDYVSRSDGTAQQVGTIVSAVVGEQSSRISVARVLGGVLGDQPAGERGGDLPAMLALTDTTAAAVPGIEVRTSTAGEALFPEDLGRFDLGASGQLLLFVFVTSMTASTALIESRKLGVSRRMFATPTRVGSIVLGEALGRITIAAFQGAIIMLGSALLFGVSWGTPLAAALLMLVFAFVAGGAALLMGSVASSTEQAVAVGLLLGLGMGALGGSMMPLEFFSPTMVTVAHVTPHAWARDGFAELVRRDGGLADVLPQLGILVLYAAVLFVVAAWGLRRSIVRP